MQPNLFFVLGLPKSGTTWLQHLLNSHPNVSCRGEGKFHRFAEALLRMSVEHNEALAVLDKVYGFDFPQFSDQEAGKGIFPARDEIRSRIEAMARFYGMLGGVTYAEPFIQKEVGLVEDLTLIPVKSI